MFDTNGIGGGLLQILSAIFGLALIALLINRSQNVGQLIGSSSNAVANLMQVATNSGGGANFSTGANFHLNSW